MKRVRIVNGEQFFTRRRGEIKLSVNLLSDSKFNQLGDFEKWGFIERLLEAARSGNRLPETDTEPEHRLLQLGFLERIPEEADEWTAVDRRASRYISDEVKAVVSARDKFRCKQCGRKDGLEFDHIVPFSKGGGSEETNVQLLCGRCNRRKSDRHRGSL